MNAAESLATRVRRQIRSALAELIWTARRCDCRHLSITDRIAVVLRRAGCRTLPPDCSLGVWVRRRTGLFVWVAGPIPAHRGLPSTPGAVVLTSPDQFGNRPACRVPLPHVISAFIAAHDQLYYTDLIH